MRYVCSFALLALAPFAIGQDSWLRVGVECPTPSAVATLLDLPLTSYHCEAAPGVVEMAVGPGQLPILDFAGFRYRVLGKLRDPYDRDSDLLRPAATDYRNEYFNLAEIQAFFDGLALQRPKFVRRVQIGTTIQSRPIFAYRFSGPQTAPSQTPGKAYLFVGITHAREWVSGSAIMHVGKSIADTLANPATRAIIGKRVVWIVPVVNPDGYNHTWTTYRLWRKNRRLNSDGSRGVDLNRNYAKGWGGQGSSGNPGSETYRGTAPFSEPEMQAVRDLALSIPNIAGFIDFHSYSQEILWPWSYTTSSPPDAAALQSIAVSMQSAMGGFGASYGQGQGSIALYVASGTSKDWFYDQWRAASYTIELRDTGQFGFELPANQITPTQNEAWAGVQALFNRVGS
ncbi:MAG: M14 metallopeptidase family protein [Fimbriimonadaceae bacterium]